MSDIKRWRDQKCGVMSWCVMQGKIFQDLRVTIANKTIKNNFIADYILLTFHQGY